MPKAARTPGSEMGSATLTAMSLNANSTWETVNGRKPLCAVWAALQSGLEMESAMQVAMSLNANMMAEIANRDMNMRRMKNSVLMGVHFHSLEMNDATSLAM